MAAMPNLGTSPLEAYPEAAILPAGVITTLRLSGSFEIPAAGKNGGHRLSVNQLLVPWLEAARANKLARDRKKYDPTAAEFVPAHLRLQPFVGIVQSRPRLLLGHRLAVRAILRHRIAEHRAEEAARAALENAQKEQEQRPSDPELPDRKLKRYEATLEDFVVVKMRDRKMSAKKQT